MLSKFTHIFKVKPNVFAYYNSLLLKPVYVDSNENALLQKYINGNNVDISDELKKSIVDNKIIVDSINEDNELLINAKSQLLTPYPTIAYFILSEKCNLACKYCFLGNSNKNIHMHQMPSMTTETVERAVEYFAWQTNTHPEWSDHKKEIIFYGGEPLINFEALKHTIDTVRAFQKSKKITKNLDFSMVTNGLLLDEKKIKYLKENDVIVSVSIDGVDDEANVNRIDKNGKSIFNKLMSTLKLIEKMEWQVGLSITLTKKTIKSVDHIISLLDRFNIRGVSFNLLYSTNDFKVDEQYYLEAANFIIDFFKVARTKGIYEDRILRKIDSFVNSTLYLSDCAATSGSQIVILPDGRVGICHGCIENKKNFFTNIDSREPLDNNALMLKWSQISPINNLKCMDCEALGICGGGCPINASNNSSDDVFTAIDQGFCIHAKKTLDFMIKDLYNILINEEPLS